MKDSLHRYERHLVLPEVGIQGVEKLRKSRVLVIGMGGLGSPILYYLAASGIGHLGISDSDTVDITNLQRQIIHFEEDLGVSKVLSAKKKIQSMNSSVEITCYEDLQEGNAEGIISSYDLIFEATDSIKTKFFINDICVKLNKPLILGGVLRYKGHILGVKTQDTPCYRCLFDEPPKSEVIETCAEAGVLGSVVGVIGTLQATLGLKYLLGFGENVMGKLFEWDAASFKMRSFSLQKRCPSCLSKNP